MIWKTIPGTDGIYQASSDGRVRSLGHQTIKGYRKGVVLKQQIGSGNGYPIVRIRIDGRGQQTRTVHSLVMLAFVGPRPEGMEVRHLDGDRRNASADNLVYGTSSENNYDTVAHGRNAQARKVECLRGHPFTDENTYVTKDGRRCCRTCGQIRDRAYRMRKAAPALDGRSVVSDGTGWHWEPDGGDVA